VASEVVVMPRASVMREVVVFMMRVLERSILCRGRASSV
jgi:hypothetical protein